MPQRTPSSAAGFSLVELLVVVAILGVLTAIAVPTLQTYRNRSRIAAVVSTAEAIRASLAGFAANDAENKYPPSAAITDYATLRAVVNAHGGDLPADHVFTVLQYTRFDGDGDGVEEGYSLRLKVQGVPDSQVGHQILVTPGGVFRCSGGDPC
ncbi:MAG: hypothetical protein KatS3mg131_4017 [Candidatus Tectimicrobiota bacterium]|nr:MAG: hypothetical protein KatS3mg131_4017 [Candidatus Tectomicrobia bacterium]